MPDRILESSLVYPVCPDRLPTRELDEGRYHLRFAHSREDLEAVLRLRFEVFNLELGEGLEESHDSGLDWDQFDPICHHLLVVERASEEVVGCYRLQTSDMAARHRGFYSEIEFNLSSLPAEVMESSLELGRACVARAHRSTQVLFLLWKGLALYVATNRRRFLFGCSSLASQEAVEGRALMRHLETHDHLHPELHVEPQPGYECYPVDFDGDPEMRVKVPILFRTYLRHGAKVCGPPAIDRLFKTIDYFVIFDVDAMDERMFQTFFD